MITPEQLKEIQNLSTLEARLVQEAMDGFSTLWIDYGLTNKARLELEALGYTVENLYDRTTEISW